jgi:hypothetical protein
MDPITVVRKRTRLWPIIIVLIVLALVALYAFYAMGGANRINRVGLDDGGRPASLSLIAA